LIGREFRVLLRHYLDQGIPKAVIAEQLGVSRRTIHYWITTGQLDRDLDKEVVYTPRPAVPTKLEPYKAIVQTRLEAYPRLSSVRLLEEVRAAGYTGSYTQLKTFVRGARPRQEPEPVVRFETAPGHQSQVDFARFQFPWGVRYALLVVLGYSRLLWLRFYARQDMRTLFAGLEEAFAFFGGVTQELLFDQMKTVITKDLRLQGGQLVLNLEFLRFSRHWQFTPRACRPYRAQTKGKIERPISYVRDNFVYGREFLGDGDLDEQRLRWLQQTANVRTHQTIKEQPLMRFEREERLLLRPLAQRPYQSLVLMEPKKKPALKSDGVPRIEVERRPLTTYARIAGGAR
jgi:transposase